MTRKMIQIRNLIMAILVGECAFIIWIISFVEYFNLVDV